MGVECKKGVRAERLWGAPPETAGVSARIMPRRAGIGLTSGRFPGRCPATAAIGTGLGCMVCELEASETLTEGCGGGARCGGSGSMRERGRGRGRAGSATRGRLLTRLSARAAPAVCTRREPAVEAGLTLEERSAEAPARKRGRACAGRVEQPMASSSQSSGLASAASPSRRCAIGAGRRSGRRTAGPADTADMADMADTDARCDASEAGAGGKTRRRSAGAAAAAAAARVDEAGFRRGWSGGGACGGACDGAGGSRLGAGCIGPSQPRLVRSRSPRLTRAAMAVACRGGGAGPFLG